MTSKYYINKEINKILVIIMDKCKHIYHIIDLNNDTVSIASNEDISNINWSLINSYTG